MCSSDPRWKLSGHYDNLKLRLSVKALDDTAATKRLVPSLLVFDTIPSLGNRDENLLDQSGRLREMHTGRVEPEHIIVEQRIRTALKKKAPQSAKYQLHSYQTVMASG